MLFKNICHYIVRIQKYYKFSPMYSSIRSEIKQRLNVHISMFPPNDAKQQVTV